jgi:hypothetical protein
MGIQITHELTRLPLRVLIKVRLNPSNLEAARSIDEFKAANAERQNK